MVPNVAENMADLINKKTNVYLFLVLPGASVIERVGVILSTCPNAWYRSIGIEFS
jgi:hypothetical protein